MAANRARLPLASSRSNRSCRSSHFSSVAIRRLGYHIAGPSRESLEPPFDPALEHSATLFRINEFRERRVGVFRHDCIGWLGDLRLFPVATELRGSCRCVAVIHYLVGSADFCAAIGCRHFPPDNRTRFAGRQQSLQSRISRLFSAFSSRCDGDIFAMGMGGLILS